MEQNPSWEATVTQLVVSRDSFSPLTTSCTPWTAGMQHIPTGLFSRAVTCEMFCTRPEQERAV